MSNYPFFVTAIADSPNNDFSTPTILPTYLLKDTCWVYGTEIWGASDNRLTAKLSNEKAIISYKSTNDMDVFFRVFGVSWDYLL